MTRLRSLLLAISFLALVACGSTPRGTEPGASPTSKPLCPALTSPPPVTADLASILVQRGHATSVQKVVLSEDGRIMVTMSADGTLLVWDTRSGLLLRRILTAGFAAQVTLSGRGDKVAYAGANPEAAGSFAILLVDLEHGGPPRKVTQFGQIALSPDGKTMAVAITTIDLYDTETLTKIRSIDVHPSSGIHLGVAFDRTGKRLAATMTGEVAVVDVTTGAELQRVKRSAALADTLIGIDFTGDLVSLRTASGAVELCSVGQAGPPRVLPGRVLDSAAGGGRAWILGNAAPPSGAPNGKWVERLTAVDPSGAVKLDEELPTDITRIAASADGSTIALVRDDPNDGVRTVTLRDGATLRPLRTFDVFTSGVSAVAVSPRGDELIAGTTLGALDRWDLAQGTLLGMGAAEESNGVTTLSFDAKGDKVCGHHLGYFVRVRAGSGGRLLHQWKPNGDHFLAAAAFVPGTSDLVSVSSDGTVKRFDLSIAAPPPARTVFRYDELNRPAGRDVGTIGHAVRAATISADGRALGFDNDAGAIGVLDLATGKPRWEITSPSFTGGGGVRRWIAFSADGSRLLLSASEGPWGAKDSILRVFDAGSGTLLQTLHTATVGPMAARGSLFALGGLRPLLLDPKTFSTLASIDSFDAEVTAVAIHPTRDLLLLGGSGGATAIASATSGKPMALFLATSGGDYVSTTPEGAYVASVDGARSLAWTFASPLEGYAFEQFAALYDRPEAVRRRLAGEPPALAAPAVRPPRLTLENAPPGLVAGRSVTLHAKVSSRSRVDQLRVFVNGRAVVERAVCAPSASVDLEIPLLPGQNRVSLVGYDAAGFAGTPQQVDLLSTQATGPRPDLWVVSVGVSRYPRLAAEHQLAYATADARSIADALATEVGPGKPFARLHPVTLLDETVNVDTVERAIAGLSAMGPDDLAVVFFAGHGVTLSGATSGAPKRMVFLTGEAEMSSASARATGVGWDRIEAALAGARGRVIVLLDACHSGHVSTEIIAPNEALARQLSVGGRAGVLVFAASRGSQLSYEVPASGAVASGSRGLELAWEGKPTPLAQKPGGGGHGLFTGSVLEALSGSAPDRDRSGAVEVGELIDFVTERVRAASNGKQTPWVARREMFGDFVVAPAGGAGAGAGR